MDIPMETELTADVRKAITDAFDTLEKNLPFLISLTPDERKSLKYLGDRNKAFVERALEAAHTAPELLPRSVVLADLDRRVALLRALSPIQARLGVLAEQIEDTRNFLGDQLCERSLEMYRYFKAAGRTEGMDELIDNIGQRFNGQGRKRKPTTPPAKP